MKRIITITIAMLTLTTTSAHAGTFVHYQDGKPAPKYMRWLKQSHVPEPNADVTIITDTTLPIEGCPDEAQGCVYQGEIGKFEVRVFDDKNARVTFLHEIGHVFDVTMLTDRQRRRFQHIDVSTDETWGDMSIDYTAQPHEHFATAYAACAMLGKLTKPNRYFDGTLVDHRPSDALYDISQYRSICKLIERASLGTGLLDYTPKGK